jgi:hypothetical protein
MSDDDILKPIREYPTDPQVFEELAIEVLGRDWIARLARAVGVNIRTAQRWSSAGRIISPQAWEWLFAQQAALKAAKFKPRLQEATSIARDYGVSENAMVALLREEAEAIVVGQRVAAGKGHPKQEY